MYKLEEQVGKRTNCARRLWFKRHGICSRSFGLKMFSDFPGLHDSHRFQQLKFSHYGRQPTAQSRNVGEDHMTIRMSDDRGVLAHSRALGKLDHEMHTATAAVFSYSNITLHYITLHYIILVQMSFKVVCTNLNNSNYTPIQLRPYMREKPTNAPIIHSIY
jgi:hypothetical protein